MAFRNNCEQPKSRHFITIQVVGNCHKWKLGKLQARSRRQLKQPRCPAWLRIAARRLLNTCIPMGRAFLGFLPARLLSEPPIYGMWHQPVTAGWFPPSDTTEVLTSLLHSFSGAAWGQRCDSPEGFLHGFLQFHSQSLTSLPFLVFLD